MIWKKLALHLITKGLVFGVLIGAIINVLIVGIFTNLKNKPIALIGGLVVIAIYGGIIGFLAKHWLGLIGGVLAGIIVGAIGGSIGSGLATLYFAIMGWLIINLFTWMVNQSWHNAIIGLIIGSLIGGTFGSIHGLIYIGIQLTNKITSFKAPLKKAISWMLIWATVGSVIGIFLASSIISLIKS